MSGRVQIVDQADVGVEIEEKLINLVDAERPLAQGCIEQRYVWRQFWLGGPGGRAARAAMNLEYHHVARFENVMLRLSEMYLKRLINRSRLSVPRSLS